MHGDNNANTTQGNATFFRTTRQSKQAPSYCGRRRCGHGSQPGRLQPVGYSPGGHKHCACRQAAAGLCELEDTGCHDRTYRQTLETKRSAFGTGLISPTDRLYVRNNLPAPDASIAADSDAWEISVEGVKNPRNLKVADLKALDLETIATVLQCSCNERGLFPNKPSGTPWQVGAEGCAVWSGVRVRTLVQLLGGVGNGMRFMADTGGEKLPEGVDPKSVKVERSVPVTAMEDALVAWEMNGEPIPVAHRGPLRLIVPGHTGVNNIKYIKRLVFTAEQSDAAIQKTGYRISHPARRAPRASPRYGKWGRNPG